MAFECRIECDSISPSGKRLTTFVVTYNRTIHSEILTHRMLSRCSASSRAIPVEKMIQRVEEDPFVPLYFGKNQKGMQDGGALGGIESSAARLEWLLACGDAVGHARRLAELGLHKQLANRVIEPWMWITVVVTATDWANFFALRCNPAAEPHFQHIANMMRDAMNASTPIFVDHGEWHLPFVTESERRTFSMDWRMVSVGRVARVSYLTHDGVRDPAADIALAERLSAAVPMHACYDEETEVLTGRGWKNWRDVGICDEFLTLSPDNQIEYQRPLRLVDEPYSGDMIRILTEHVDVFVTPNHNMLASRRRHCGFDRWELVPAFQLTETCHRLRLGEGVWESPELDEAEARLLGFFIGDGNYSASSYCIAFHLRRQRKIDFLRQAAQAAGFLVNNSGDDHYRLSCSKSFKRLAWSCYEDKQKRIPEQFLRAGRKTLLALLDGLMASDGSVSPTGKQTFATTSPLLASQFQEVAVKVGMAASCRLAQLARVNSWGGNAKPCYSLCLFRKRNIRPKIGGMILTRAEEVFYEPYNGRVYCATVPNGILYVRRNGKPLWCGNSPFGHIATPDPNYDKRRTAYDRWVAENGGREERWMRGVLYSANLHGWHPYRHELPNESVIG